ncbi:MAG TPA: helix-turn-helix domain-containing protein [Thermomicrobiales bacterium]|nr:helix-turn-helix domain-containing protein [Thermomicrobiales bacterium]
MIFALQARPSDSPYVDHIWRAQSQEAGSFYSIAACHWEVVVTTQCGHSTVTVRGPETKATRLDVRAGGEWIGIRFRLGTCLPDLPVSDLVDAAVHLPDAGSRSFFFRGEAWRVPDFENADAFVGRLVRDGLLVREPVVDAALDGRLDGVSPRTAQRRFVQTTGLTQGTVRQIERARRAMSLLQDGVSILDVVHETGYYDQPHLTRALKHFLGQTPAQIAGTHRSG